MKNKDESTACDEFEAPFDEIIERWFVRNFQNWAGYETSLYNHAYAAKEELKKEFFNLGRQPDVSIKED